MTDAFRCEGCGDYYDQQFNLVNLEVNPDALRAADLTLDDLPVETYDLTAYEQGDGPDRGDYCVECGMDMLELLVAWAEDDATDPGEGGDGE